MLSSARFTVGALCWAAAAPLFLAANVVTGLAWQHTPFSWADHNVSDLGNVTCGVWDSATRPRYICSPWHDAMNVAFVLTAALLIAGLILTRRAWGGGLTLRAGQVLMLLGALGLGLAGIFPADRNPSLHLLAALLVFGCGNAGLAITGCTPQGAAPAVPRAAALGLGVLGLAATVLFFKEQGLGLGVGGMERLAVFPVQIWCFFAACRLLGKARSHSSKKDRTAAAAAH